jgi:hypothetical protein
VTDEINNGSADEFFLKDMSQQEPETVKPAAQANDERATKIAAGQKARNAAMGNLFKAKPEFSMVGGGFRGRYVLPRFYGLSDSLGSGISHARVERDSNHMKH